MKKRRYPYLALILTIILGTHKGFLALWRTGEEAPLRVFPLAAASLPPADQQMLARGIPIESQDQLNHLLEDYLS